MIRKVTPSKVVLGGCGRVCESSDGRQVMNNATITNANLHGFAGTLESRQMAKEIRTGLINGLNAVKGMDPFFLIDQESRIGLIS